MSLGWPPSVGKERVDLVLAREPLSADEEEALADAEAMEARVVGAGIALEQVHHGDETAAVNRRAVARGHGIRTGLEDTVFLPDGRLARDNAELVAAARALLET